jgi:D-3-phosphoglycerate dehydrogenase
LHFVTGAAEKGIAVCNTPGMNSVAVAELVFGHMINYDRKIVENVEGFQKEEWNKGAFAKSKGLKWSTLGIIGFGNIGKAVCVRAKAFEMNILAYDPYLDDSVFDSYGVTRVMDINEIAKNSDIITLHCPGGLETKNLINAEFLGNVKNGVLLINTARGTVVDEEAVIGAINKKSLFFACDVLVGEPQIPKKSFNHHFQKIKNIAVTPHIGASTLQAERACGEEAINIIKTYALTGDILHKVN